MCRFWNSRRYFVFTLESIEQHSVGLVCPSIHFIYFLFLYRFNIFTIQILTRVFFFFLIFFSLPLSKHTHIQNSVCADNDTSTESGVWSISTAVSIWWAWFRMCSGFDWWQPFISIWSCNEFIAFEFTVSHTHKINRASFISRWINTVYCLLFAVCCLLLPATLSNFVCAMCGCVTHATLRAYEKKKWNEKRKKKQTHKTKRANIGVQHGNCTTAPNLSDQAMFEWIEQVFKWPIEWKSIERDFISAAQK